MSWSTTFREIRSLRLQLARLDPAAGAPPFPPPPASVIGLAAVERRLGRPLPPSYRGLLGLHDGVTDLYRGVALLGAHALARGTYLEVARAVIELDDDAPTQRPVGQGFRPRNADLVPFALDARLDLVLAWDLTATRADGELGVVVWASGIADRVDDFSSALELVREMARADVEERRRATTRSASTPVLSARYSVPPASPSQWAPAPAAPAAASTVGAATARSTPPPAERIAARSSSPTIPPPAQSQIRGIAAPAIPRAPRVPSFEAHGAVGGATPPAEPVQARAERQSAPPFAGMYRSTAPTPPTPASPERRTAPPPMIAARYAPASAAAVARTAPPPAPSAPVAEASSTSAQSAVVPAERLRRAVAELPARRASGS